MHLCKYSPGPRQIWLCVWRHVETSNLFHSCDSCCSSATRMALVGSCLRHDASGSCLTPDEDGSVLNSGSSHAAPLESLTEGSRFSASLRLPPASPSGGSKCGFYNNLPTASILQIRTSEPFAARILSKWIESLYFFSCIKLSCIITLSI